MYHNQDAVIWNLISLSNMLFHQGFILYLLIVNDKGKTPNHPLLVRSMLYANTI